jgi:hypothetical protein
LIAIILGADSPIVVALERHADESRERIGKLGGKSLAILLGERPLAAEKHGRHSAQDDQPILQEFPGHHYHFAPKGGDRPVATGVRHQPPRLREYYKGALLLSCHFATSEDQNALTSRRSPPVNARVSQPTYVPWVFAEEFSGRLHGEAKG